MRGRKALGRSSKGISNSKGLISPKGPLFCGLASADSGAEPEGPGGEQADHEHQHERSHSIEDDNNTYMTDIRCRRIFRFEEFCSLYCG